MADLTDYRQEIDALDSQLVTLFERRMEVVEAVGHYKKKHKLPVLHADREREVLDRAVAQLRNKAYSVETERLMEMVMALSRAAQHAGDLALPAVASVPAADGAVGFYGAEGSFSEQAAMDYFGENRARLPFAEFSDVFEALRRGDIAYGVLPIENSSTGAIAQVYDLLGSYGFYIAGERRLRIRQNLVAVRGASLTDIRTVYSHHQGFEQSSAFLARHPDWARVPFHSTSLCASRVAAENSPANAAIASERAAALYGLQVLAADIQDSGCNSTRFIVIGRTLEPRAANKVSLVFSLDNASGTLYGVLRFFADQHINLVKIESRPIPDSLWNYLFYLDFEGDPNSSETRTALAQLARTAKTYRLLGAYRRDAEDAGEAGDAGK